MSMSVWLLLLGLVAVAFAGNKPKAKSTGTVCVIYQIYTMRILNHNIPFPIQNVLEGISARFDNPNAFKIPMLEANEASHDKFRKACFPGVGLLWPYVLF